MYFYRSSLGSEMLHKTQDLDFILYFNLVDLDELGNTR